MRVLVSAGPTRERIDPVRFISNRSSGKMGYALAAAAVAAGHETVLVSGPVNLAPPAGLAELVPVESAAEMAAAVKARAAACELVIMAAAVADYRPAETADRKLKKQPGELLLRLERTEDILAALGRAKPAGQCLVGFAAETENLLANAAGKLERKNLDFIVANLVADGFGSDDNRVILIGRDGSRLELGPAPKTVIARQLLAAVAATSSGSDFSGTV